MWRRQQTDGIVYGARVEEIHHTRYRPIDSIYRSTDLPLIGEGQEPTAPEEVVQKSVLLQAYQAGSRGCAESTPVGGGCPQQHVREKGRKVKR